MVKSYTGEERVKNEIEPCKLTKRIEQPWVNDGENPGAADFLFTLFPRISVIMGLNTHMTSREMIEDIILTVLNNIRGTRDRKKRAINADGRL